MKTQKKREMEAEVKILRMLHKGPRGTRVSQRIVATAERWQRSTSTQTTAFDENREKGGAGLGGAKKENGEKESHML